MPCIRRRRPRLRSKKRPESGTDGAPDAEDLRGRALALLARREHSALELKRKLLQRGYPPDQIDGTLRALADEGLLSEKRYASEWVRSRAGRGQGPVKIRAELRQRGLGEEQVQQALAATDTNWARLAGEVRRKRFGPALPASMTERARQTRFLESRGFTAEHIRAALGGDPLD